MTPVLISCVVPTLNRNHTLRRAILSTIAQTYPNWEMIIVDDGSEDKTRGMVLDYMKKDARIKYYRNPGKGAGAARNHGVKNATGEWIAFLDDDVFNKKERFEKQLWAAGKLNSQYIISGLSCIGKQGKIRSYTKGWWAKGAPMTSCWFIKKELLLKSGMFDERMPSMEDTELSYRIAEHETYANLLRALTIEEISSSSVSKGMNGIIGKKMLMNKHKGNMEPLEAASWYYSIGTHYFGIGNNGEALKHLKMASELDHRNIYRTAYGYARLFLIMKGPIRRINSKVLSFLYSFRFPKLVNHPTIE